MTQQQASPRLRLDRRFFEACDRLPMSARAAVLECLTKLLENPAHPSLKYEAVRRAADPRMRSIRINEQYRVIVAHPEGGSEYLLLWQLPTPRRASHRLTPFFRLPGRVMWGTHLVTVELRPFNDRRLTCDLAELCQRVEAAQPRLPDGRSVVLRVASSYRSPVSA